MKMLEPDFSFHDFARSIEGIKIAQKDDGVLVKEPFVKAITS